MKLLRSSLYLILLLMAVVSCDKSPRRFVLDGFTQGGTYRMVYFSTKEKVSQREVDVLLWELDNSFSLYNPHSLLSRINRGETDTMDLHIQYCIETARQLSEESDGLYDVTVKPLIAAIGFADQQAQVQPDIDSLLLLIGYRKIHTEGNRLIREVAGMQIDLNSIAQGYTVDKVAELFRQRGLTDFIIELGGGEIYCSGQHNDRPWRVGVDRPVDNNFSPGEHLQVILNVTDRGLATSGNYRKFYIDDQGNRVNHTVDPLTGQSVTHNLLSATVMAENATLADGYSTMFMVMGLEKSRQFLENRPDLSAYLVYSGTNGKFEVFMTDNMSSLITEP